MSSPKTLTVIVDGQSYRATVAVNEAGEKYVEFSDPVLASLVQSSDTQPFTFDSMFEWSSTHQLTVGEYGLYKGYTDKNGPSGHRFGGLTNNVINLGGRFAFDTTIEDLYFKEGRQPTYEYAVLQDLKLEMGDNQVSIDIGDKRLTKINVSSTGTSFEFDNSMECNELYELSVSVNRAEPFKAKATLSSDASSREYTITDAIPKSYFPPIAETPTKVTFVLKRRGAEPILESGGLLTLVDGDNLTNITVGLNCFTKINLTDDKVEFFPTDTKGLLNQREHLLVTVNGVSYLTQIDTSTYDRYYSKAVECVAACAELKDKQGELKLKLETVYGAEGYCHLYLDRWGVEATTREVEVDWGHTSDKGLCLPFKDKLLVCGLNKLGSLISDTAVGDTLGLDINMLGETTFDELDHYWIGFSASTFWNDRTQTSIDVVDWPYYSKGGSNQYTVFRGAWATKDMHFRISDLLAIGADIYYCPPYEVDPSRRGEISSSNKWWSIAAGWTANKLMLARIESKINYEFAFTMVDGAEGGCQWQYIDREDDPAFKTALVEAEDKWLGSARVRPTFNDIQVPLKSYGTFHRAELDLAISQYLTIRHISVFSDYVNVEFTDPVLQPVGRTTELVLRTKINGKINSSIVDVKYGTYSINYSSKTLADTIRANPDGMLDISLAHIDRSKNLNYEDQAFDVHIEEIIISANGSAGKMYLTDTAYQYIGENTFALRVKLTKSDKSLTWGAYPLHPMQDSEGRIYIDLSKEYAAYDKTVAELFFEAYTNNEPFEFDIDTCTLGYSARDVGTLLAKATEEDNTVTIKNKHKDSYLLCARDTPLDDIIDEITCDEGSNQVTFKLK